MNSSGSTKESMMHAEEAVCFLLMHTNLTYVIAFSGVVNCSL